MASTSMTLGPHWEAFIKDEIASGRYASASEVIRAGLRELEERKQKLEALRAHLDEGIAQAEAGEFDGSSSADTLVAGALARASGKA